MAIDECTRLAQNDESLIEHNIGGKNDVLPVLVLFGLEKAAGWLPS